VRVWVVSSSVSRVAGIEAVRTESIHPHPTLACIPPLTRPQVLDIPLSKPLVSLLSPVRAVTYFVGAADQQLIQKAKTTYRDEFPPYSTPLDVRGPSQFIQFMAQQRRQHLVRTRFPCDGRCGGCMDRRCSGECTFVGIRVGAVGDRCVESDSVREGSGTEVEREHV
jgi:hypothetical protein